MSEIRCYAIEFPGWCWNPHMIQHVKQFWLSCVCVTNTRNVELQLIQFACSILECGSWFSFLSWSTSELKFCFNIWKTAEQTNKKYLKLFTELKLCLTCESLYSWKGDMITVRVIQGVGSLLLHIIWKWLQLFVNCWPETITWLEKWWKIGFTLTGRQFPVHSKRFLKKEDLHRIVPRRLSDEQ
jgi:hypothetical protein